MLKLKYLLPILFIFLLTAVNPSFGQRYGRPQVKQNPNFLKQQAFEEYIAGEFESSADLYKQALDAGIKEYGKDSDFVFDLYYELGTMSLEEGNFTRAARYLPKAVQLKPNSVLARVKLSDLYLMQGRVNDAFGEIHQAQKRNPNSILAQKQLVKLMMERTKKSNKQSDAANLACTMESFKLTQLSNSLVNGTNNLISQWHKRISSGSNYVPPRVSVAMSTTRVKVPVKVQPIKIKPPQNKKPSPPVKKVRPKKKPKPKPKARVAPKKIKKVTKPIVKSQKAKPKPKRKVKPRTNRIRKTNGLVPPPPPMVPPVFTPPVSNIKLETKAKVESKKKTKKKKKKKKIRKKRTVPDEPDFILDWASKKKKN